MIEHNSITVKILVFGVAQDSIGTHLLHLEVGKDITTVGQLKTLLVKKYPKLGNVTSFLIAINAAYADDTTPIVHANEIALIPPTSGG
jgi:molybdopterin converting factor subunit 1